MVLVLDFDVDEIAIMGQFADKRIDLAQCQLGTTFQIPADKSILIDAQFECGRTGIFGGGHAELFSQGEYAENAADAGLSVLAMKRFTERTDLGAGARSARQ